ncbi:BLUF domain-containing protein [Aquimarina sediminis]|uniref:BLUF domain-containing protein n=1 Tax=Aquimarina sediminis TaxID=2070536 RepID=UPI000CA01267|nr:BLUF domain-containing protein [Aquimarina sediminis]
MLKGIVYVSEALVDFSADELIALAADASNCNVEYGITGYLYYEKGFFLQYIEGDQDRIDTLMDNIDRDKRHRVHSIESTSGITSRKFPNWHMKQLTRSTLIQINMENVLMDYMTHCSKKNSLGSNHESIWRMIDKLSGFRKKLSYSVS